MTECKWIEHIQGHFIHGIKGGQVLLFIINFLGEQCYIIMKTFARLHGDEIQLSSYMISFAVLPAANNIFIHIDLFRVALYSTFTFQNHIYVCHQFYPSSPIASFSATMSHLDSSLLEIPTQDDHAKHRHRCLPHPRTPPFPQGDKSKVLGTCGLEWLQVNLNEVDQIGCIKMARNTLVNVIEVLSFSFLGSLWTGDITFWNTLQGIPSEKENHLQKGLGKGYVSCQKGTHQLREKGG